MSEITKAEKKRAKTKDSFVWIFFALLVVFVYFFAIGSIPLLGPDEPRYSQIAREMFERGDWTTPTLGGFDWFEKPALLYWLQIAAYKIFGVSEFAARFGSALCGLGTIFSLWILGKKVRSPQFAVRSQESKAATLDCGLRTADFANWLFLVAASSIGILAFARGASFDIILTFPVTASLVGFFIFDQRDKKNSYASYFSLSAFYFFIGVALLAKGLVGIVFPFAIVAFYFVLRRKLPCKSFIISLLWGTILSLAVAALWYAPMYLTNGWKFVDEFFIQHQFQRYTSNKFQHPQPFWFFLLVLPLMTLPWLPFFLAAIWRFVKEIFSRENVETGNQSRTKTNERQYKTQNENSSTLDSRLSTLKTFAVAWMLVPLVFFSFSGSKLPGYILPALPAAIILTAETVWRFVRGNQKRARTLQIFALATFACVIIVLQFFVSDFARGDTVKSLIETADARGFENAKVVTFNEVSHNAEFYAAGRLIRTADGKQRRFFSAAEIADEIKNRNAPEILVLTPLESLPQLTNDARINAEVLSDNGELAIVSVKIK